MTTIADLTTKEAPKWCPGCVLPGTFIQSNPSVKKIETIKTGERVLGKDGKFHKVTEVMVHRHRGKMHKITAKCFGSTILTEEHPVLCVKREKVGFHNKTFETEWMRADSLRRGDYLVYPILSEIDDKDFIEVKWEKKKMDRKSKNLPNKLPVNSDLLRLASYYIAEGNAHNRGIVFTFNKKEIQYVEDVKLIIEKIFGLKATSKIRENKNTHEVHLSSSQLTRLFIEWFGTGAANKRIPHFMMVLPPAKQKELLKGSWRGDGYIGSRKAGYKTISKVMTEQIKMLLLRQSIVPSITENKAYGMHKTSYNIEVCGRKNLTTLKSVLNDEDVQGSIGTRERFVLLKTHVFLPIRKIETFDYDGDVYNFEVEDVHSYVSGNATLHNCGDFTILSTIKSAIADTGIEQHNTLIVSGIGCLPPDEQVSVGSQWVCIDHLKKGHTVVNGDGEFTSIEERMIKPFEGEMLEIVPYVSTFNRIRLTPEHPVLSVKRNFIRERNQISKEKLSNIKPEFIEAGKLEKGDYVVFSFTKKVTDNPIYTKDFCRLLGYYLAEGYVNKGGGRNRDSANVSFAINSNEKRFRDDLIRLSVKLTGKEPYVRHRKNIGDLTEVTICSKELALLLEKIAGTGAGTKKLIGDAMLLPIAKQKEIIKAYFRGDGWHGVVKGGKNIIYRANTLSKILAVQMQEMLARTGIFATIYIKKTKSHTYKNRVVQPSGQQYVVSFQHKKQFSMTHRTAHGFLLPIGKINKKPYRGIVHNFQTSNEPHSYLVKGIVVHNCGSKTPHFVRTYGFEGLHGRGLAVASGAKLANNILNVIAVAGDGDTYGIGGNHFMHSMRRNLDMTLVVQNNEVYGLTKGQTSPTSEKGFKSNSTPNGVLEDPVNPITWAITAGATYVARGYAMDIIHLKKLIADGMKHKGFALIDVFQPCSTYNKINTMDWYKSRIFKLEDTGHNPEDKLAAMKMGEMWGDRIPIGLFYRTSKPTYEDGTPQIATVPLARQDISNVDISGLLKRYK